MQTKVKRKEQFLAKLMELTKSGQFTQKQLAEWIGVGNTYITQIKTVKTKFPSEKLLEKLEQLDKKHFSKAEGSETHLREPTVPYAAPMDKILGRAVAKMAIELAESLEFASVDEYLRYLIRAEHAARFGDGGKAPGVEPGGGVGGREAE